MRNGPGKPVELGGDEDVAFPDIFDGGMELYSLGERGDLFLVGLLTTDRRKLLQMRLKGGSLIDPQR